MHPFPKFDGGIHFGYLLHWWEFGHQFYWGRVFCLFFARAEKMFLTTRKAFVLFIQCGGVHVNRRRDGHMGLYLFWCNYLYLSPHYNPSVSAVLSTKKLFFAKTMDIKESKKTPNVFLMNHSWDCQLYTKPFIAKGKDILSNIMLMRKFY